MDLRLETDKFGKVLASLSSRKVKGNASPEVLVGYTAPYALVVHEDLERRHKPPTQAKFLETPYRLHRAEINKAVREEFKKTLSWEEALLAGAELLLEESRPYVPVLSGALKASGVAEASP